MQAEEVQQLMDALVEKQNELDQWTNVSYFVKVNFEHSFLVIQGDPKLCLPLPGRNGTGPSKTDHITF